ncbi:bactofilin family protein [Phaeocystidibacter luteus]|uniref:Polymer-forming cytoskeletal protein n=1 Tax=Phaeocystidibacter luteus TaxID=911197 RepID=A0A6N6RG49_9FLAO|nr:polymer-forming cytoskeletal protein [Phaeocystidibacter luteus]KAB2810120.1 polymer-forming cytoskeletal protein [Phaeocystidibacter luteus]
MITSAKKNPEQAQASNRILIGTEIEGDVKSNGDIRIDGVVKGNIQVTGKLVIGEKGKVEGEVVCSNATVSGLLKGKAEVKELLTMTATAVVQGDVVTGKLSVEPGAELSGTCNMGAVVRKMERKNDSGEESKESKETA